MKELQNAPGSTLFCDYIRELPHGWILDNLISSSAVSRRIVSSAMISEAAAKFSAKAALIKRYKGLSPTLRLKCAQVYLTGGMGQSLDGSGALAKNPLITSLLVYAARVGAAGAGVAPPVRLFGFREFEPVLRPLMAQTLADAGAAGDTDPHAALCPWRPLSDVAAVCSFAFHGALTRSAHGGLARSSLGALRKLVNDPTLCGKSVADCDTHGHPAGLLIGYCLKEGLLIDIDNEYKLNERRFTAWLESRMKDRMRKLYDYAVEFSGGFDLGLLRETILAAKGRFLSVNFFVPESERAAAERAVGLLEFFGMAHTPRAGANAAAVSKFTSVMEPEGLIGGDIDKLLEKRDPCVCVMMPDFTAIIPQEATPDELFEFSRIGLLTACDKVYKGRVSKESISNSLSAGTSAETIREGLKSRRAPSNVVRTAEEWIREFGRLYTAHGSILAVSEERVAKQIAALEPLKKYLTKIEAHTVYMIKPCCDQKVIDALEKLGFDAREPGGRNALSESGVRNKFISVRANAELKDNAEFGMRDLFISAEHNSELTSTSNSTSTSTSEQVSSSESELSAMSQPSPDTNGWRLITDFSSAPTKEKTPPPPMRGTKYGSRLKPLGISEMIHVIDYAMLTSQSIIVDYEGSTAVKQDIYTVTPLNLDKGVNASVEAQIPGLRGRKKLFLDKISRIGVVA